MQWQISSGITEYSVALDIMQQRVHDVQAGKAEELIWLLEHPPLYTAGSSAKSADYLQHGDIPVFETGRGGQYTYHGPGQRVVYLVLDLNQRGRDLRAYVQQLEQWVIDSLAACGVQGFTREGRVGVWVHQQSAVSNQHSVSLTRSADGPREPEAKGRTRGSGSGGGTPPTPINEAKIAALGVRCQKWVVSHGIAINVNPDLSHYAGIVPCGIREYGVTSLKALGNPTTMQELDGVLARTCPFTPLAAIQNPLAAAGRGAR
jgi:lipoyl(octanoyl) transferase